MTTFTNSLRPSAFAVFRNRSFRMMWTAQLVSTIGDALTSLAAGILIFRLTGSALSVGLISNRCASYARQTRNRPPRV